MIPIKTFNLLFQVLLSWLFNLQRIIPTNHLLFVLFLACFTQTVSLKRKQFNLCLCYSLVLSFFSLLLLSCPVYADGSICLDILQNQWSPIYDVAAILTSIQVSFWLSSSVIQTFLYCLIINHCCGFYNCAVSPLWSQPKLACKLRSCSLVQREQAWVQQTC